MARKRIEKIPALKSWADVDDALCEIAENELAISDIETEMNRQLDGARKIAKLECAPHADRIAKLERDIEEFAGDHRGDLGNAKSKTLTFGEVGYRQSTSVSFPKAKEKVEEIIRRLKARKMTDCIIVTEKPSAENLKKYGEDVVSAVGATWKQKDVFGYEAFKEKLEQLRSGQR